MDIHYSTIRVRQSEMEMVQIANWNYKCCCISSCSPLLLNNSPKTRPARQPDTGLNCRSMVDGAAGRSRGRASTQILNFRRSPASGRQQRLGSDSFVADIKEDSDSSSVPIWHNPVIENPAFDEYYKVGSHIPSN